MRNLTQFAQREPPYARATVLFDLAICLYSFGRKEAIPGSLVPQSPHIGPFALFLMYLATSLPPGVLMGRIWFDLVLYAATAVGNTNVLHHD